MGAGDRRVPCVRGVGPVVTAPRAAFLAKHAARIARDPVYGCWIWTGPIDRDGYGTSWGKDGPRRAHLVAYRELVGPVPAGRVLDHLCRRRACCRPEHLEPVTHAENDMRRVWRYRARRTTCPNGHTLSTCITTPSKGKGDGAGRLCRTCQGPETE